MFRLRITVWITLGGACALPCYGVLPNYTAMAVDRSGNIWVSGYTNNHSPVPVTPDAFQPNYVDGYCGSYKYLHVTTQVPCDDAFVIKLDPSGTRVLYATYLGGQNEDVAVSIAASPAGGVYVTGYSSSKDFPVTSGVVQTQNKGPIILSNNFESIRPQGDVFVTKFNENGSIAYSTFLGGTGTDVPVRIQVDSADFAYVAGNTDSADFPLSSSPLSNGPGRGFLAKLSPTGSVLTFSTYYPGAVSDLAIDALGLAYVSGTTTNVRGGEDAYLSKISAAGNRVVYTTNVGGWMLGSPLPIAVYSHGKAWISRGGNLLQVAPDGSRILEIPIGPSDSTFVAVDSNDNVYVTGYSDRTLNTTPNAALVSPCAVQKFIFEATSSGVVVYSSFLRQVPGLSSLWVTAPGHVLLDATTRLDLTAQPPPMNFGCPVNGASFVQGQIVPGEIVSLFGYGLGPVNGVGARLDEIGHVPTTLAGVRVLADGVPAPILYAQYGQVNIVMPAHQYTFTIQVQYNGQSAPSLDLYSGNNGPGIFAVLNQDGSVNSPSNAAAPGSTLQSFVTGLVLAGTPTPADGEIVPLAPLTPLHYTPSVMLGSVPADVTWAGLAPGLILGVEQVNIRIPQDILHGAASASVPLSYYGVPYATVNIAIAR